MSAPPGNEYSTRQDTLEGILVGVTSYRVGIRFSARVDNVDPGAIIGRGQGSTRVEAERAAIESAALTLKLRSATEAIRQSTEQLSVKRWHR